MIHLNEFKGLLGKIIPELYGAITINDFLRNKNKIKSTSELRNISPFAKNWKNYTAVMFRNIDLEKTSSGNFIIKDTEDSFECYPSLEKLNNKNLDMTSAENGKYERIIIRYSPSKNLSWLYSGKKMKYVSLKTEKENLENLNSIDIYA